MHIGLIGGIGPAATEFYYRGLVKAHKDAGKVMDLTIVHADSGTVYKNFRAGRVAAQVENFLIFIERLQAAGAEAVAVTALAAHYCIRELEAASPLPVINSLPVLNDYFKAQGLKTIGLLGTDRVMESHLYGGVDSVKIVIPAGGEFTAVHDAYITMALSGFATEEQRVLLFAAARKLCEEEGAGAVALGGTDLFMAFDGHDCGCPVIDCATVHLEAIAKIAMGV